MQMLDAFLNYFSQHPIAVALAAIAVIIILIWMTGSGSRQRFITFKRTKETDQLARDLSRIAAALEKIARQREMPMDYVNRPIPQGWENSISAGEPVEEFLSEREPLEDNAADAHHAPFASSSATPVSAPVSARAEATASGVSHSSTAVSAPNAPNVAPVPPSNAHAPRADSFGDREGSHGANPTEDAEPARRANPLGGTADLLGGKKKLDLPNPLYRPKR